MPTINLKATLQAYSKAPFYGDYVRDLPAEVAGEFDPTKVYVRQKSQDNEKGQWVALTDELQKQVLELMKDELALYDKQFDNLGLAIDYQTNTLYFIDKEGNLSHPIILPQARVDGITIGINDDNRLYVLDTPDDISIKVVDSIYNVEDPTEAVDAKKISGKLRAEALYDVENNKYISGSDIKDYFDKIDQNTKNISDLEAFVQGTGGFLDPYNFGKSLTSVEENEKNSLLNRYAWDQLFGGDLQQIPDQTKVKNTYTGNIWVYIQETNSWVNEGQDTIVTATNDGVLGSVTGIAYNENNINTKFKISIDTDDKGMSIGTMSVNGLEDEFQKVVYKTDMDAEITPGSYVRRTSYGSIRAEASQEDIDVINQGQFNEWYSTLAINPDYIHSLFPEFKDGGNN